MSDSMKSFCSNCGSEITHLKDSTGEYLNEDEIDLFEYPDLCHVCAAKIRDSEEPGGEVSAATDAPDDGMPSDAAIQQTVKQMFE